MTVSPSTPQPHWTLSIPGFDSYPGVSLDLDEAKVREYFPTLAQLILSDLDQVTVVGLELTVTRNP